MLPRMRWHFSRLAYAALAVAALIAAGWGCSDRGRWTDELVDELATYEQIELVTFNIAGTIICDRCTAGEIDVMAVKVEVIPQDDPLKELAIKMFDNVGPFTIPNLRYKKGVRLTIHCGIYTGLDTASYSKSAEVTVPDEDGDTVAVSVTF